MPDRAADPTPDTVKTAEGPSQHRAAGRLAWLAGAACVACCALPALVAAGLLGGGALAVAAWLPTLAVAAVALVGWTRWRRARADENTHGCAGSSCGCATTGAQGAVDVSVRSRP